MIHTDTLYACLEYPTGKARQEFSLAVHRLYSLCKCRRCVQPNFSENTQLHEPLCTAVVTTLVVVTMRNLSLVHPDTELQPYRSGLEALYRDMEVSEAIHVSDPIKTLLGRIYMCDMYETAVQIYTGRKNPLEVRQGPRGIGTATDTPPVFHAHGMTFYLDILRELSDCPGDVEVLHAVPGCITLQSNRVYGLAKDQPPTGGLKDQVTTYTSLSSLSDLQLLDSSSPGLAAKLTLTENVGFLALEFCFSKAETSLCGIGPAELANRLARSSYSVFCPRRLCHSIGQNLSSVYTVEGEGKVDAELDHEANRLVVIRQMHGNKLARCISMFQVAKVRDI